MINKELVRSFVLRNRAPLLAGGALLLVIIIGLVVLFATHRSSTVVLCSGSTCSTSSPTPQPSSVADASPTPTPTPSLTSSKLSGAMVPVGSEALRPLAVMIENHPDARPQSGLGSADLVYEAIAEGGITRFMAVFGDPRVSVKVGPIRSARTYYVDFATELGAFYAHVGGNADALDELKSDGRIYNLDEFSVGEPTFAREFNRNVALEHTMYSTTDKLWNYATSNKNTPSTADYQSWQFAADPPASSLPQSQKVTINFSSSQFQVTWNYDPTTNSYSRVMAGQPHIDVDTNKQITAKNIILETVAKKPTTTRINEQGWIYTLTGSGSAVVINNGHATPVTWKKSGTDRTRYYTTDGKEVTLTEGTTWVEIVHTDIPTTY